MKNRNCPVVLKKAMPVVLTILAVVFLEFLLSLLAGDSTVFVFWGTSGNAAAAAEGAAAVRSTARFDWTFIALFAVVVYIYATELKNHNYKGIVAALALYGVHWLYEIANAVIAAIAGHALWTVSPESSSFILLVGVSWELSMMFAIAGLAMSKLLPDDPTKRILGMNNRIFFALLNAAFFSLFEIFLAGTPAFIWVDSWWGAIPVFLTTYIPFFLAAFLAHDAAPATQRRFLIAVWGAVAVLLALLVPLGVI